MNLIWDDTVGGPTPERRDGEAGGRRMLEKSGSVSENDLAKVSQGIAIAKPSLSKLYQRSLSMEGSPPASPTGSSPASTPRDRENVWRSVFNPGSNRATKKIGSQKFDNAQPNSPTVYDWLYSGETRSKWR